MDFTTSNEAHKERLLEKIKNKTAIVGVIGLGYVGLPFAVEKAKVGFRVIGIDQNKERVEQINQGESYISDINSQELTQLIKSKTITAVTEFTAVTKLDTIIICVPTPLTKNLTPDLQYIESVTKEISKYLRPGQLICLESTTYPGTTDEVMLPILEASGYKAERDFFLAYSPERVDPGNTRYSTKNTNKIVGGIGADSLEVAERLYKQTVEHVISVSSTKSAELVKVFENTFRAVNIALVNELMLLCDRMQLNVWEILDAAFTKPFGIMPFYPGPGVGGHCIPIDPHYLEWKAKELNFNTHFIALAGEINRSMPFFVQEKVTRLLNETGKAVSNSSILIMGVAYKKDFGDFRESPVVDVIRLLNNQGARVKYHDPHVPVLEEKDLSMKSQSLTKELITNSDLVIIATNHSSVDYESLVSHSRRILDTRNATRDIKNNRERITLL